MQLLAPGAPNEEERFGVTDHPVSKVIVGMNFEFDSQTLFELDNGCAVEIGALDARLRFADTAIRCERRRIAKVTQIKTDNLPVVAQFLRNKLSVAVILPPNISMEVLMQKAQGVPHDIISTWSRGIEAAANESRDPAIQTSLQDATRGPMNAPAPRRVNPPETTDTASKPALISDSNADRVRRALLATRSPGDMAISLVVAGQVVEGSPITFTPRSGASHSAGHFRLGEEREIVAKVNKVLVQGCCEIREEGASRNRTATFGTMDNLGTMLKMLAGCPPVVLCVREYTAQEASTPARHAYRIERLVALTAQWKQQPGYLEDLGSCVDELRTMLQSAADKPTTG